MVFASLSSPLRTLCHVDSVTRLARKVWRPDELAQLWSTGDSRLTFGSTGVHLLTEKQLPERVGLEAILNKRTETIYQFISPQRRVNIDPDGGSAGNFTSENLRLRSRLSKQGRGGLQKLVSRRDGGGKLDTGVGFEITPRIRYRSLNFVRHQRSTKPNSLLVSPPLFRTNIERPLSK